MMGTLLTFDVAVPTAVAADAGRNHRSGSHHLRHKAVQAIRLLTRNAQQGKGPQLGTLDTPVDVHVQQRCTTRHRRDPDNVSGPGKAILDELVAVGRLPDDSWRHVGAVTYSIVVGCDDVEDGCHVYRVWVDAADREVAA